jgi:hypothetical protein
MSLEATAIDYLNPGVPDELPWHEIPIVKATNENLKGYGHVVDHYRDSNSQ